MTMHPEDAFNMTIQSYAAALEAVSKISACTPELAAFGLTRYYHGEHQFNYAVYRACLSMTIIKEQYAALQVQISLLQPSTVVASSTIPATQVSTVASVASPPYHKPPRLTMHPIPSTLRRSKRVKSKNTAPLGAAERVATLHLQQPRWFAELPSAKHPEADNAEGRT